MLIAESQAMHVHWKHRDDTLETMGQRCLAFIDHIKGLHPSLDNWSFITPRGPLPLADVRHDIANAIAGYLKFAGDDYNDPEGGTTFALSNCFDDRPDAVLVRFDFGARSMLNATTVDSSLNHRPDPSLVDHAVWKNVFAALIESVDGEFGNSFDTALLDVPSNGLAFDLGWMTYVPPFIAAKLSVPPTILVDRRDDGSLILSATGEIFDATNPGHLAGAKAILNLLAPVQLPNLNDYWGLR